MPRTNDTQPQKVLSLEIKTKKVWTSLYLSSDCDICYMQIKGLGGVPPPPASDVDETRNRTLRRLTHSFWSRPPAKQWDRPRARESTYDLILSEPSRKTDSVQKYTTSRTNFGRRYETSLLGKNQQTCGQILQALTSYMRTAVFT